MIITDLNFFEQSQTERGIVGGVITPDPKERSVSVVRESYNDRGQRVARLSLNSFTRSSGGGGSELQATEPIVEIGAGFVRISATLNATAISPNFQD
jgi:hypothetical protein